MSGFRSLIGLSSLFFLPSVAHATTGPADVVAQSQADAFEGEFTMRIATYPDGTTQTSYHLVRDSDEIELAFDPEGHPEFAPGTIVQARGSRLDDGRFEVEAFEMIAAPPQPLIDPEKRPARRVAMVMLYWGDTEPANPTKGSIDNRVFRSTSSVNAFYQENSYGKDQITGGVYGWFQIPEPGGCSTNGISLQARNAMADAGYNLDDFDQFMYYFPRLSSCGWAGLAAVGAPNMPARDSWYNGSADCVVLNQELGHNYGMLHSRSYTCRDGDLYVPLSDACTEDEYGDPYDPMGSGCAHMSTVQKAFMGWLEGCNIVTAPSDGVFAILPTELPCNGTQSLRLPLGDGTYYHLEYRQPIGAFDRGLGGVQVRLARQTSGSPTGYIIDMDSESSSWAIRAGNEYEDYLGRVHFSILEENPTHALVQVTYPDGGSGEAATCADGSAPEQGPDYIGSLECADDPIGPDTVAPMAAITAPAHGDSFDAGASFDVLAEASDDRNVVWVELYLDGNPVYKDFEAPYEWTVTNPEPGNYSFVAVASDGLNYFQSEAVEVTVGGDGTGDGSGEGDGEGTGDDTAGDEEEDDGGDGEQDDDGDNGCGCRQINGDTWLSGLLIPVLLSARRRRNNAA